MKFLLNNSYAPTTFSWGFVGAPFERTAGAFSAWTDSISKPYGIQIVERRYNGPLPALLQQLFPVVSPRTRQMLVETNSQWTAYFDNAAHGGDPISAVGQLCEMLKCQGVAVTCCPHRNLGGDQGVLGGVQFQLFASHETHFINHLRYVGVTSDGDAWEFSATGPVQPFEEALEYGAYRVRDRFTPEMLERYCKALGIDLFSPDFYGPKAMMIVNETSLRPGSPCLSRDEAHKKLGLL